MTEPVVEPIGPVDIPLPGPSPSPAPSPSPTPTTIMSSQIIGSLVGSGLTPIFPSAFGTRDRAGALGPSLLTALPAPYAGPGTWQRHIASQIAEFGPTPLLLSSLRGGPVNRHMGTDRTESMINRLRGTQLNFLRTQRFPVRLVRL